MLHRLKRIFSKYPVLWFVTLVFLYFIWVKKLFVPQVLDNYFQSMTGGILNDSGFKAAVSSAASGLGVKPEWLIACMYLESSLNPSAVNSISGATGLIQFMPSTAISLGTTVDALSVMSAVEQMPFVVAYLQPYSGKMQSFVDVYLAIFYPAAIGESDDFVIGTAGGAVANENAPYCDSDGNLTVGSLAAVITQRVNKAGYGV